MSGYIYILTNPSFKEYVKIGYAQDVKRRLKELNRSECIPFAFRIYATYEVDSNLSDKKLHQIIDTINPSLRSIENFEGKQRKREFYAIPPEDAYEILKAIAEIHGRKDKIKKYELTNKEEQEEQIADEVEELANEKLIPVSFNLLDIKPGEKLEFSYPNSNNKKECIVIDDKHVEYDGKTWSLSSLAQYLLEVKYGVAGPRYFKYKGKKLNQLRREYSK